MDIPVLKWGFLACFFLLDKQPSSTGADCHWDRARKEEKKKDRERLFEGSFLSFFSVEKETIEVLMYLGQYHVGLYLSAHVLKWLQKSVVWK